MAVTHIIGWSVALQDLAFWSYQHRIVLQKADRLQPTKPRAGPEVCLCMQPLVEEHWSCILGEEALEVPRLVHKLQSDVQVGADCGSKHDQYVPGHPPAR